MSRMTTHAHRAHDRHEPEGEVCPTCGPTATEPHPRREGVTRCANCKEWLTRPDSTPTEREAGDVGEVAARVRALADEWEKCIRDPRRRPGWSGGAILADLRAALDGEV